MIPTNNVNPSRGSAASSSSPHIGRGGGIITGQCNIHHCQAAAVAAGERVSGTNNCLTEQTRIVLVQEPYIQNKKVKFFHKNINIYASADDENRACIITHKSISGFILRQFTNRDQTAITV
jgi:hypothetical protein